MAETVAETRMAEIRIKLYTSQTVAETFMAETFMAEYMIFNYITSFTNMSFFSWLDCELLVS